MAQNNTTKNNSACFRSMIWVNKNQKARQAAINHSDLTAIYAQVQKKDWFIASIYIPYNSNQPEADEKVLGSRLNLVKKAFMTEKEACPQLEVILAWDFNRWDTLWGGNLVASNSRQGEGPLIIGLMADLDLQLLLLQGTITYRGVKARSPYLFNPWPHFHNWKGCHGSLNLRASWNPTQIRSRSYWTKFLAYCNPNTAIPTFIIETGTMEKNLQSYLQGLGCWETDYEAQKPRKIHQAT